MTAISDEFLEATNRVYNECAAGIEQLSRAIVSLPDGQTAIARTHLVPALYAYWERFFRTTLAELLRVISVGSLSFSEVNHDLAKLALRKRIRALPGENLTNHLHEIVTTSVPRDATNMIGLIGASLQDIRELFSATISFVAPEEYVDTESNVRYGVVEKNLRGVGFRPEGFRDYLKENGIVVFVALKELVDTRNAIAHGESIAPLPSEKWEAMRCSTLHIMNALQIYLHSELVAERHMCDH